MTENSKSPAVPKRRAPTLYFIVAAKVAEGSLLLMGAVSVYLLAKKNLPDLFDEFIRWMHLDPEGRFFGAIGDRLETVTPGNVHAIASWMFLYGLFKVVGGLAFFIPIEIFELIRRHSPKGEARAHAFFAHPQTGIAILLAVNVLIFWYLLQNRRRLFRHHHH